MRARVMRLIGLTLVLVAAAGPASGGDLRLIDATRRQDSKAVETLLKAGIDVDQRYGDGATALHWTAILDNVAIAELLIRAGANTNAVNDLGITPLIVACTNRSLAMVELLLKGKADPNAGPAVGETAVMEAARTGSAEVMSSLLAHGGNVNLQESYRGHTALMWAASEKHPRIVEMLIKRGADVHARTRTNAANETGSSAAAGRTGSNGANGYTALLFAARVGDLDSARLLLAAGADSNDKSEDGLSALALATVRGYPAVAKVLLEAGADPNSDGAGYTPLLWAAGSWESELTTRAVTTERDGEWSRVVGLKGNARLELVRALVAHGADPNARLKKAPARAGSSTNPELPELEGATPLLLAATAGAADVMEALVENGAQAGLTTKGKGTLLMAAAGLGRIPGEVNTRESDSLAATQLALQWGADVNATDAVGNAALHYAAYMRRDSIVEFLVKNGAKLDITNKFGETALWAAELSMQFAGGGRFFIVPSSTGDVLRRSGAQTVRPHYERSRPTQWPDVPRAAADNAAADVSPK